MIKEDSYELFTSYFLGGSDVDMLLDKYIGTKENAVGSDI